MVHAPIPSPQSFQCYLLHPTMFGLPPPPHTALSMAGFLQEASLGNALQAPSVHSISLARLLPGCFLSPFFLTTLLFWRVILENLLARYTANLYHC